MDMGLMGRRCTHMVIVWCVIPWYLGPRFLRGRGGDRDDNRHHPSAQVIRSGTICLSYLNYMNLDAGFRCPWLDSGKQADLSVFSRD